MLRNSSTYIYLAVALGLFCYLAFIDKKVPGTQEREKAETQLFQLNPDDVIGLEITNVHGIFIFQKNNNHWELKRPVNTLADGPTVDGIINQIAFAQPLTVLYSDKFTDNNLKEWGLVPPAERVIIHTLNKQYELLVGRKVAINDSVYSRASGRKNEPVRVIPSSVKDILEKDLSDFRSRSVFDFAVDKVTKIATRVADTSTTHGQQCELDRKDDKWTLQLPLVARASTSDVQALLGRILGEHAIDFVTDDSSNLSSYGLTSPSSTITVSVQTDKDKPAEDLVLQIGSPVPNKPDQVYAQRLKSSSVFTLTAASVADILKSMPNVRDLHILPFDSNKVTGISYSFGSKKAQLVANHALWSTVGSFEGSADPAKSVEILTRLGQMTTTPALKDSATDLKPFGLDKPQGKITLQSPEFKSGSITLLIGKAENKLLYVQNSVEPFIYTVPDNSFDFLPAGNLALRDPRVINLKVNQAKSMTITAGANPPIVLTRTEGGTWSTNVKDRMVDILKADPQLSLVCQLQAKTWLGPVLPAYGLSKPVLTIAVLADQPTPTILHIGAPLPDGTHAAQIEGNATAFAISDGDYSILNSSTLLPIPAEVSATNAPSSVPPPATTSAPATNAPSAKK